MARRLAFTSTASPGQLLHALGGLTEVLAAGGIADGDEAEGLRRYAEHVERIGEAASDAAYPGLQDVCLLFRESLQSLSERSAPLTETQRSRLNAWPELVQAYIESPGSPDIAAALIDYLRDPSWDSVLSEDDAEMLKAMLAESSADGIDQAALAQGKPALEAGPDFADMEAPELPAAVRELVEILLTELPQIEISVSSLVGLASSEGIDADVMSESFENSAEIIERLGSATESVGFHGLYGACRQACENLRIIATERLALNAGEAKLLQDWIAQVRAYLTAPAHPAPTQGLVQVLAAPWWPKPLMDAELEFLRSQLLAPDLSTLQEESVSRQQLATADDVSLELPEDVNQDLLDSLLQELPNQTEEFSAAIQRLIKGGTLEDVNIAQRIAHTLKGAGNTVGVRGLAYLTHHLEDILLALAKHQALPTRSLAETMMNAADCLEGMTEALLSMANPPADAQAVLQGVLDWANRIDHEGLPTGDEIVSSPVPAQVTPLTERAEPSERQTAAPTTEQRKETEESSGAVPMIRVPASLVDNLLRLVGETIILTGQIHERLRKATSDARAMQTQFDLLQQLGAELEEFTDIKDLSSRQQA